MSAKRKSKLSKVDKVVEEILAGNEDTQLIRTLNQEETIYYEELVDDLRHGRDTSVKEESLWRLDYYRQPPPISQFIDDDYYLGEVLRPGDDNEGIFPEWRRLLIRDFNLHSKISNLIITGSLGIGKTWMMVALLLYRLVCATCLRNPQHFFGISRGSRIAYLILSVTKEQVKDTAFGDAMNFMAMSPFFTEECRYDPDLTYSGFRIPIRNTLPSGALSNLVLSAGSRGQHALGKNVVAVALDEGNFRLEENPDLKAYQLYEQVRTRIANRFQKRAGFLPAISIIASSASDESSFTEKVIREIEEINDPKTQRVYRHAVYVIKRHTLQLKPWWFKVAYGLKNIDPFVLEGLYRENGTPVPPEELHLRADGTPMPNPQHESPPPGARTELVPGDYYEDFRRNPKAAIQNHSGISVGGSHRLFSSMMDVLWCIEEGEKMGLRDPCLTQMFPISAEDDKYVWDYLDHKKFLTIAQSRIIPVRHPQHKRYCHIDFAKTGMCGLAVCHLAGNQMVHGLVKDGEPYSDYRLIVEYDFIVTILPGQSKPINFEKVQRFFFWLRDMCGYQIGLITADMYQSTMPLQVLEARGFEVDELSLDRDKSVYDAWRMGFDEHRIRIWRNEQMLREAEQLLEADKKYDHPPEGSKDTCVALDSKIRLLNGKTVTVDKLVKGKSYWVYAIDKSGRICAAKAKALGITRENTPRLKITLDNGKHVICTPDHLIMLRNGSYLRADQLVPGQSLMPFYFKRSAKGYGTVFNPATNRYEKVYKLVDEQFRGHCPKDYGIHHDNLNKRDDQPKNLKRLTNAKHWAIHRDIKGPVGIKTERLRQKNLAEYNAKPDTKKAQALRASHARKFCDLVSLGRANGLAAIPRLKSPAFRKKHSRDIKRLFATDAAFRSAALKPLLARNEARRVHLPVTELQQRRAAGQTNRDIALDFKVSLSVVERRIHEFKKQGISFVTIYAQSRSREFNHRRQKFLAAVDAFRRAGLGVTSACRKAGGNSASYYSWKRKLNHKVVSIKPVKNADVTCLRVYSFANFAIEAGIFIHNCDAAAGAFWNAVNSDEKITISSSNEAGVYTEQHLKTLEEDKPPIEIILPETPPRRKVFVG